MPINYQTDLRAGGVISAKKFNDAMREVGVLSKISGGRGIKVIKNRAGLVVESTADDKSGGKGGGAQSIAAIITINHDNHLTCTVGGKTIQVAKPWEFRRSTWDGRSFIRGGQVVSYAYRFVDTRTSMVGGTPDEREVLIHSYEVDDELEVLPITHATGVAEVDGGTKYIDLNVGGRNWGFVDPQT